MTDVAALVRNGDWHAHRYDPGHDAIHFVDLPRAARSAATFLTDEYLGPLPPKILARHEAMAAAPAPAPLAFVFHSAFCGSTLLARAFALPGVATVLSEPVILNDLVGWRWRGGSPASVAGVLGDALRLLARPHARGEAVLVKPSNLAAGYYTAMLGLVPKARAVLLYAPLRDFLTSIAKKGLWGRLWVRELFAGLRADGVIGLGLDPAQDIRLTDLQIAAAAWLAQQALFARLQARFGARVMALDSTRLMADPTGTMAAVARHFALTVDAGAIAAGPAFTRHAKDGSAFSPAARVADYAAAASLHADEIDKVAIWADAVARAAGIQMNLDKPR